MSKNRATSARDLAHKIRTLSPGYVTLEEATTKIEAFVASAERLGKLTRGEPQPDALLRKATRTNAIAGSVAPRGLL